MCVSGDAVKVVHLLMGLQPSGLERMLVSAAPYFRAVGVRSTLVSQGAEQPFASELQAAGYSVVCIPPVKTSSGRRAWASVIRHEQPDVIHIHPEQAFAAAILVGHRAAPDARIVRTVHSYFPATGWWGIKRRLQLALSERHVSATVFLNQEMAAKLTGLADPAASAAALLRPGGAAVVVTHGAAGSWFVTPGQPVRHQPAIQVEVVDTNGCGDVFHGAYAACLAWGGDVPTAVRVAAVAAGLKARKSGGRPGIPSRAQVEERLAAER